MAQARHVEPSVQTVQPREQPKLIVKRGDSKRLLPVQVVAEADVAYFPEGHEVQAAFRI